MSELRTSNVKEGTDLDALKTEVRDQINKVCAALDGGDYQAVDDFATELAKAAREARKLIPVQHGTAWYI